MSSPSFENVHFSARTKSWWAILRWKDARGKASGYGACFPIDYWGC